MMADKVELSAEALRSLLESGERIHGRDWAVEWLRVEWNKQPFVFYDMFMQLAGKKEG